MYVALPPDYRRTIGRFWQFNCPSCRLQIDIRPKYGAVPIASSSTYSARSALNGAAVTALIEILTRERARSHAMRRKRTFTLSRVKLSAEKLEQTNYRAGRDPGISSYQFFAGGDIGKLVR